MQETNQTTGSNLLTFDPIVILADILRRWYLIAAVILLVGAGTRVAAELTYVPVYTTSTTFAVAGRSTTSVYDNLARTSEMASVFTEVLNSSVLREKVLEELDMDSFDGTISAEPVGETNLLTMTVTSSSPRTAFLVSRAIIANHHIVSAKVLGDVVLDVIRAPEVPTAPSNAKAGLRTAHQAALLAGAAMALALGFFSFQRDTVRSRQEVGEKLDCRYLGEVLHERKYKTLKALLNHKKSSPLITRPDVSFHFSESIQKIRRRISRRLTGDQKVVLVTSVLENEGKSTIAANLALSFAQMGRKTLLMDCDLRKPACWKIFQRRDFRCGTLDVISGRASLEKSVVRDPASELDLLFERETASNASELLTSRGMEKLLAQARASYDMVILDMPPMSVAPDAEAAAGLADGTVLVVRQNTAAAAQINRAAASLKNTDTPVLGCVLNNLLSTGLLRPASYGYGYGGYGHYGKYGHYGNYGKRAAESRSSEHREVLK